MALERASRIEKESFLNKEVVYVRSDWEEMYVFQRCNGVTPVKEGSWNYEPIGHPVLEQVKSE